MLKWLLRSALLALLVVAGTVSLKPLGLRGSGQRLCN
jgi:hypothetical protein